MAVHSFSRVASIKRSRNMPPSRPTTQDMHDAHDRFFKSAFGDARTTASYLRATLDPAVGSHIDWDNLRRLPTESADRRLAIRRGDLHFEAPIATETGEVTAAVWLHLEHQSRPDPRMAMRVLEAMVRAWEQWEREHPDSPAYPAIVPVVLYNGTRRWKRRSVASLCGAGAPVAATILRDVNYILHDLQRYPDLPKPADDAAHLALATLFAGTRPTVDVVRTLRDALEPSTERPSDHRGLHTFAAAVEYLWAVRSDVDNEMIDELTAGLEPDYREVAVTYGEQLVEQGRVRGLQQGIEQGIEQEAARHERAFRATVHRMRARDMVTEDIAELLGVSVDKVAEALARGPA